MRTQTNLNSDSVICTWEKLLILFSQQRQQRAGKQTEERGRNRVVSPSRFHPQRGSATSRILFTLQCMQKCQWTFCHRQACQVSLSLSLSLRMLMWVKYSWGSIKHNINIPINVYMCVMMNIYIYTYTHIQTDIYSEIDWKPYKFWNKSWAHVLATESCVLQ